MKLEKSIPSAIALSSITVLIFAGTIAILYMLIPYLISGNIRSVVANPDALSEPGSLAGLVIFVLILLLALIAMGAFWLYRFFGDKYYGPRGAAHWILFGFVFALLIYTLDLLFRERLVWLQGLLQFLSVFPAFFLARWIARIPGKRS